ncbi:MAG: hypothetical protein ACI81L_001066 [Verrucomicrobiales bacterium]|jgi:hypothetical protein
MAKTVDLSRRIKSGAKVRATIDLPGVPEGTAGKVAMSNGLTWKRYWVRFENGELLGHIDHSKIVISRAWDQFFVEKQAAEDAALDGATAGGSSTEGATAAADNAFGVPQYLLDRTKAALERAGVTR